MGTHDEFLEFCASATAGELSVEEHARLDSHLAVCADCRRAKSEYEAATIKSVAVLAAAHSRETAQVVDSYWSAEKAEAAFFKRQGQEQGDSESSRAEYDPSDRPKSGMRFTYRSSQIHWRDTSMPFAAAILLALALGVALKRAGPLVALPSSVHPGSHSQKAIEVIRLLHSGDRVRDDKGEA
jgi:hypothetical protein